MDYKVLKNDNFTVSNWTGGKTKELAIFPAESAYLERNFIWRLSSATCEMEESDFSKLPDYDRVLVVLEGQVVLAHEGVRVARLNPLEQDRFDGAYKTRSFGKITDYNLMVAKGNQGFVDVISLTSESQTPEVESYPEYNLASQGYYCVDGFATLSVNGKVVMIKAGEQFVIDYSLDEDVRISVMGEGKVIRSQVYYNYQQGDLGPTIIPKEKATFDDFLQCVFLANSQFRGAKYIFKRLKTQWIDEELSSAIKKIERVYVPYFICTLGICIVAFIGIEMLPTTGLIIAMACWVIFDILIVSPLLYFAVVPKPVKKHIKDINHLTPYEEKVLEREAATNERLERLLKKYKYSGKVRYDEEGNGRDTTF